MTNTVIVNVNLPINLWEEALLTTCHLHNEILSRKSKISPYEFWKGRKYTLNYLRIWGCLAYYKILDIRRTKLGTIALKSVFVDYAENSKAYRCLDLDSNIIVESRDMESLEDKF